MLITALLFKQVSLSRIFGKASRRALEQRRLWVSLNSFPCFERRESKTMFPESPPLTHYSTSCGKTFTLPLCNHQIIITIVISVIIINTKQYSWKPLKRIYSPAVEKGLFLVARAISLAFCKQKGGIFKEFELNTAMRKIQSYFKSGSERLDDSAIF